MQDAGGDGEPILEDFFDNTHPCSLGAEKLAHWDVDTPARWLRMSSSWLRKWRAQEGRRRVDLRDLVEVGAADPPCMPRTRFLSSLRCISQTSHAGRLNLERRCTRRIARIDANMLTSDPSDCVCIAEVVGTLARANNLSDHILVTVRVKRRRARHHALLTPILAALFRAEAFGAAVRATLAEALTESNSFQRLGNVKSAFRVMAEAVREE